MEITSKIIAIILSSLVLISPAIAGDEEGKEPVQTSYVEMDPSIVSNLTGGPKYIRCNIQLMTKHASNVPEIELHMPALRHTVLMLLAGADGQALLTREGKEDLRKQALASINKTIGELSGKPRVDDLYFTAYYVK